MYSTSNIEPSFTTIVSVLINANLASDSKFKDGEERVIVYTTNTVEVRVTYYWSKLEFISFTSIHNLELQEVLWGSEAEELLKFLPQ